MFANVIVVPATAITLNILKFNCFEWLLPKVVIVEVKLFSIIVETTWGFALTALKLYKWTWCPGFIPVADDTVNVNDDSPRALVIWLTVWITTGVCTEFFSISPK